MIDLAAVLIFVGQTVLGVPPPPPRDCVLPPRTGTGVIKGHVVDGTTGAAVARARIMLQGQGAGAPAVTDADGGFTFTSLPPGPITLMVQKSTYLPARYPAGGRTMRAQARPLILRDGQALDNVVVPMFHGGSISGRVFDANGDPVEFAQVSLLRLPPGGRTGKSAMRQRTQTNDLGEFRLGRIEEGTYAVQVSARRDEVMFGPTPPQAQPPPPLPQPVPTFYPSAVSIDQAQPIVVDRSQAVTGIDVVLGEGVPGVVTGVVLMPNGQPLPANVFPNVMIRRVLSDVPGGYDNSMSGAMTRPDGTFRAVLAPGEYMLEARLTPRSGGPSKPEDELFASQRVTVVSGGEESLAMTVGPGATATGRVVFEGTTPPPASPGRARIPMFSEGGMCRSGEAEVAADWSFRLAGLSGTCSAQPSGFFGRWILKAVVFNGQNLLDGPVTFQPGQQLRNVQVVVTDKQSSMVFEVSDENGQATRDYVVVAYPVEKERWTNGARTYMPPIIANTDAMRSPMSLPGPANPSPLRPPTLSGLRTGE